MLCGEATIRRIESVEFKEINERPYARSDSDAVSVMSAYVRLTEKNSASGNGFLWQQP
jgi:hypothetical protein